ncbi:unnamed protein product [Nezara viridula]|uniref:C1q domain-containing protein n=1 Tax=Nezara viridula TaxID=85310 RepID=A0A9P0E811_NEZVI|nr:unnamed protein product [Nezara viridula]
MKTVAGLILVTAVVLAMGATPEPPRSGVIGAKGLATAADCSGAVGFSATGLDRVHSSGLVSYRTTLVDRGVGFSRETGEFTVHCPGIYHVAFAAYSDQANTKIVLKKRTSNSTWTEVAGAGGNGSGGGSNQILLDLGVSDQTGVWLVSGDIAKEQDRAVPSTTFTAFRIAKK